MDEPKSIRNFQTVYFSWQGYMFAWTHYESMPSRNKQILREAAQPNIALSVYAGNLKLIFDNFRDQ